MLRAWPRLAWSSLAAALWVGCGPSEGPARQVRRGLAADGAGAVEITLAPSERVSIETDGARFGRAPRLHLWDPESKREVAFGDAAWFRSHTALEYQNPHPKPRAYLLLYEAAHAARGRIDLRRDGRSWLKGVPVAVRLPVPPGKGFSVQLASVPGPRRTLRMFGLDCRGRLVAVDRTGGPTGLPRIAGLDEVCSVVVNAPNAERPARADLYVNDNDDRDGDGLGRALERALGTCDGPEEPGCERSPLAQYYRGRGATRDTDRDGLTDRDEVFGAARLLDLPRYGASPLHKDVMLELDHDPRLSNVGLSEADLVEIAGIFAAGSASELKNPDGKPGVRLHFDAGFEPEDPKNVGLLGDWGGSGRTKANNYRAARSRDFTPARTGYFRYAYMTKSGRGQARRDSFTVNRNLQRVSIFAHELGHTLGLEHHGHAAWGVSNCKPHYYSIMNYVYQNRPGMGFSRASGLTLDPGAVLETLPLDEHLPPAEVLRDAPLELDVDARGIDWNRDGVISREPVRAALAWATYKSCGAAAHARTTLAEPPLALTTPELLRLGGRLYALYVTEDGLVQTRHSAVSGPDAMGSCPEGDGAGTRCSNWSLQSLVHGLERVLHLRVLAWGASEAALGYARADGQLRVAVVAAQGEVLDVLSDVAIAGATSEHAPALARARVAPFRYGAEELLRVFFRAQGPEGGLLQATALGPSGPFTVTPVFDTKDQPLQVGLAPSVRTLGTGELCGVFPDREGYVRFYCYDVESDAWADLTATAFFSGSGPKTSGPVSLAYHRARLGDGSLAVDDPTRGALIFSFTEPESFAANYPDNPHYFISEWLSADKPASTYVYFRWRGSVIDEWTNLAPGTGLALYEDELLSALKGLMLTKLDDPGAVRLDFLPFADGVHHDRLAAGNDFEVMELGICERLKGAEACTPPE